MRFLLALVSLFVFIAPACAQFPIEGDCATEDPQPLFFTHYDFTLSGYACGSPNYTQVHRFSENGTLVRVEIELTSIGHQRQFGYSNYDLTAGHVQTAWFGDRSQLAADCIGTSRGGVLLPSGYQVLGDSITYLNSLDEPDLVELTVQPYGTEGPHGEDLSDAYASQYESEGPVNATLRHSADWAGMVGSGYFTTYILITGTCGYSDSIDSLTSGGQCFASSCEDWWPRAFGQPYAAKAGYLDTIGIEGTVTYVWTTP